MRVYLASPCIRPIEPECAAFPAALAVQLASRSMLYVHGDGRVWDQESRDSNQARARNVLFHRFLASGADAFLGLDADMLPELAQVEDMLDVFEGRSLDVLSAMYTRRSLLKSLVGEPVLDASGAIVKHPQDLSLIEARRIGFGCLLASRDAIAKLTEDALRTERTFVQNVEGHPQNGERIAAIVTAGPHEGGWEPTDDSFSRRWRMLDGKLWLRAGSIVGHVGPHVFA